MQGFDSGVAFAPLTLLPSPVRKARPHQPREAGLGFVENRVAYAMGPPRPGTEERSREGRVVSPEIGPKGALSGAREVVPERILKTAARMPPEGGRMPPEGGRGRSGRDDAQERETRPLVADSASAGIPESWALAHHVDPAL